MFITQAPKGSRANDLVASLLSISLMANAGRVEGAGGNREDKATSETSAGRK